MIFREIQEKSVIVQYDTLSKNLLMKKNSSSITYDR
jgi:hypothetical protein